MSEDDLASLTGVDVSRLHDNLERLVQLGAIRWVSGSSANRRSHSNPPGATAAGDTVANRRLSQTQMRARGDAEAREEPTDLEPERQRRVLEMYTAIHSADHYALLGVAETADRKEIKRAYYSTAPEFHPDKFFGKRLGSFKPQMEAVFAQLTVAYETLSSSDKRAAYDAYLAAHRATATNARPAPSAHTPIRPVAGEPPPRFDDSSHGLRANPPTAAHRGTAPATPQPPPNASSSMPPRTAEDERARRAALARKLSGGRGSLPPDARRTGPQPDSASMATDELRKRQDALVEGSRRAQVQRHVDAAKAAPNPAAASNAYRLALALDPENPEIIRAQREAAQLAAVTLAQGYLKQAESEARAGQHAAAARSYARAVAGMPENIEVLEAAAQTSLKAGVDMHQAVQFARQALALAPQRMRARYVLIEAYLAAKLPLAAKRELDSAREIAAHDDTLDQLAKRLM